MPRLSSILKVLLDGQVMSGISFVSGWAFSTSPTDPVTVRLQIDGGASHELDPVLRQPG